MGEIPACFGEGLGAYPPNQIGLVDQMGEEGIELVLNAGLEAGQQGDDQDGKGQESLTKKGIGIEAGRKEKFVGVEIVDKVDKNAMVLRSS